MALFLIDLIKKQKLSLQHPKFQSPDPRGTWNVTVMYKQSVLTALTAVLIFPCTSTAFTPPGRTTTYNSPGGINEQCVALDPMPGGRYSSEDRKREKEYCSINFYAPDTALCPKIWSTSPGTIIYDISQSSFAGRVSNFEQTQCRQQKKPERLHVHRLAKLKTTMNAPGTSGTFSTASLLYYHFLRYFRQWCMFRFLSGVQLNVKCITDGLQSMVSSGAAIIKCSMQAGRYWRENGQLFLQSGVTLYLSGQRFPTGDTPVPHCPDILQQMVLPSHGTT